MTLCGSHRQRIGRQRQPRSSQWHRYPSATASGPESGQFLTSGVRISLHAPFAENFNGGVIIQNALSRGARLPDQFLFNTKVAPAASGRTDTTSRPPGSHLRCRYCCRSRVQTSSMGCGKVSEEKRSRGAHSLTALAQTWLHTNNVSHAPMEGKVNQMAWRTRRIFALATSETR